MHPFDRLRPLEAGVEVEAVLLVVADHDRADPPVAPLPDLNLRFGLVYLDSRHYFALGLLPDLFNSSGASPSRRRRPSGWP